MAQSAYAAPDFSLESANRMAKLKWQLAENTSEAAVTWARNRKCKLGQQLSQFGRDYQDFRACLAPAATRCQDSAPGTCAAPGSSPGTAAVPQLSCKDRSGVSEGGNLAGGTRNSWRRHPDSSTRANHPVGSGRGLPGSVFALRLVSSEHDNWD